MKIRLVLAAAVALAMTATATFVAPAHAADPTYEADVGGGAAGVVTTVQLQSYFLRDALDGDDHVEYTISEPRVVMGRNGGSKHDKILNQKAGAVRVKVADVAIKGNRFGTPYAEARTSLTNVSVVSGDFKGTEFGAIDVYCKWDRTGWVARTLITNVNGEVIEPAPNTTIPLPGGGFLTLNEQYTDRVYLKDASGNYVYGPDGNALYAETVYVAGAHLSLAEVEVGDYDSIDLEVDGDIWLGFTSCDPLVLPNLSGLKLSQTAT